MFSASFLSLVVFSIIRLDESRALRWLDETRLRPPPPVDETADEELVFVQLWRHGDRNPNHHFPKDKNKPEDWTQGGGGLGQLTPLGMKQHMQLGRMLRDRYKSVVNGRYVSNEIYVRSTDVNRTIVSAIANMIGFYDGAEAQADVDFPNVSGWPKTFVPVPIHTQNRDSDYIHGCPDGAKHAELVKQKVKTSKEYEKVENENKEFLEKLKNTLGLNTISLSDLTAVFDTLFVEKIKRKEWPDGIDEEIFNKTRVLAAQVDDLEDGIGVANQEGIDFTVELAKIYGGPLLSEMIGHINAKRRCLNSAENRTNADRDFCVFFDPLKYYAYSAHDRTIGSLFATYGFKETNWNATGLPHYASSTALELFRTRGPGNQNSFKVKVIYWPALLGPLDLTSYVSGCGNECTLEQFSRRSANYMDPNFKIYCDKDENNGTAVGLAATYMGLALFFLIAQWIVAARI